MSTTSTVTSVKTKDEIQMAVWDFAQLNTDRGENYDGSYHGNITIEENTAPFETFEDAEEYLETKYDQSYRDGAVRYYVLPDEKDVPSKAEEKLRERIQKNRKDKETYDEKHSVTNLKSKLISCKCCGSKIAKSYLRGDHCPVCYEDLRAEYILTRLNKYDTDCQALRDELEKKERDRIKKYVAKNKKKAEVRWAVKISVRG